jgi:hypothetical protein
MICLDGRTLKRAAQPVIEVPKTQPVTKVPNKAQPLIKSCPLCNHQVREDRLRRHMSSKCPLRVKTKSKRKRGRKLWGKLPGAGFLESIKRANNLGMHFVSGGRTESNRSKH